MTNKDPVGSAHARFSEILYESYKRYELEILGDFIKFYAVSDGKIIFF